MSRSFDYPPVDLFGEHFAEDQLTVATMNWPDRVSGQTYTIAPNHRLSLELDSHFPVTLAKIAIYGSVDDESEKIISDLVGAEATAALTSAPLIGSFFMELSMSLSNRLHIAALQIDSPSTSPRLRQACETFVRSHPMVIQPSTA